MLTFGKILPCLLAPAAVILAGSERVQSPDAQWKTIKTLHYRIHYPANPKGGFEPFVREVASKIEGIHNKVAEWVGYEVKGPVDVFIQDPILEANGAVVPYLKKPIMMLWKTPPEMDSAIGHYDNWVDLLLTHEITHLHHLTRPQNRGQGKKSAGRLLGPISIKAPRLITEGYATLIEGRVTGSGRPHSAYRAAVIRQWAIQGKLPDYEAASASGGFRGGSMAYLVGSAYLDWLERQNSQEPDILKKFWKQLASKKRRSYDGSFKATFGISPEDSYDRWRAEVTHDAIALEQNAKARELIREGQLVARFNAEITHLALSQDGSKLMARVLDKDKPGVRIWDLNADPESDKSKKKKKEPKPEEDDPNEVKDREPEFTEPKLLTVIGRRNGILPRRAWWTGSNQVTFEMRIPNGEGVVEPAFKTMDLETKTVKPANVPTITENNEFTWKDINGVWNIVRKLPDGQEQQITNTLSAAWQPAPTPDGKSLYYVRLTATGCEIRKLDLAQPALKPAPLDIPESLLVKDTIISPPNGPNLLPPPADARIEATDYSVWDSHRFGIREGYSLSSSSESLQVGFGGSDLLGRLSWHALGAYGASRGPRGGALGVAYRGWRFAPSLQVFSSLEKPSAQRFEPISGFDRERRGAEIAFTWRQSGMSPILFKPFAAWESVKNTEPNITDTNRYLTGAEAAFAIQRSRGENWGIGVNSTLHGAFGRTEADTDASWKILRLKAGLRLKTPLGPFDLSAEEGRMYGDYSALDAFHLGGQNTNIVPDSLDLNRLQQPALPGYTQTGGRMRKLRADYGFVVHAYFEKAVVWSSQEDRNDYQRVAGIELRLDDAFQSITVLSMLGSISVPSISIGIHRPFDGIMKNRTVGTLSFRIKL